MTKSARTLVSKRGRISLRTVEALDPGEQMWDVDIRGFVVRHFAKVKTYAVKARISGRQRFITIGDAGVFVDPEDPSKGLIFSGRVVEDFKLTTGTFVLVGSLRTDAIAAASPVVQDALVAGQDRPFIGLLAWPNLDACRRLIGDMDASLETVVNHPKVRAHFRDGLLGHNKAVNGVSSMTIARAMLMVEPPSIDGNELTDKGYINQRAGLERRAALVEQLYADQPGPGVIVLG